MKSWAVVSQLHDENTFYKAFAKDLQSCRSEVYIESPFITLERAATLIPIFKQLLNRGVRIYVMTRNPKEHELDMEQQSEAIIRHFEALGVQVLLCLGNHHRKLAILDRKVVWEGSLNILSQTHSRELMRRIEEPSVAEQTFEFLQLYKFI